MLRDEDRLLSALLAPLADAEDQLDEDEMDKLPPGLQYWEGRRETDRRLLERVLSTLYQVEHCHVEEMDNPFIFSFVPLSLAVKCLGGKEFMHFYGNLTRQGDSSHLLAQQLHRAECFC